MFVKSQFNNIKNAAVKSVKHSVIWYAAGLAVQTHHFYTKGKLQKKGGLRHTLQSTYLHYSFFFGVKGLISNTCIMAH